MTTLLVLATRHAQQEHFEQLEFGRQLRATKLTGGPADHVGEFSSCPHPTCRLVREQGWQPIETAPKDGRWIWARRDQTIKRASGSVSRYQVSAFQWDVDRENWFAGTGWWPSFPAGFSHWSYIEAVPPAAAQETHPDER